MASQSKIVCRSVAVSQLRERDMETYLISTCDIATGDRTPKRFRFKTADSIIPGGESFPTHLATSASPAPTPAAPTAATCQEVCETGTISDKLEVSTLAGQRNHHGTVDDGVPPDWSSGLAKLRSMRQPSDIPLQRWLAILKAATIFQAKWAATAAKLGWTVEQVFGVHYAAPTKRFDAAGLLMSLAGPDTILVELTADQAIFEVGRMRARQTLHRSLIFSHEQRLLWENGQDEQRAVCPSRMGTMGSVGTGSVAEGPWHVEPTVNKGILVDKGWA